MEVKGELGGAAVMTAMGRAAQGLHTHLVKIHKVDAETAGRAVDIVTLSVSGLKQDRPSVKMFRERLTFLAQSTALSCAPCAVRGCRQLAHGFHSWLGDVGIVTGC